MNNNERITAISNAVKGIDFSKVDNWEKAMLLNALSGLCLYEKSYNGEESEVLATFLPIIKNAVGNITSYESNDLSNLILGNVFYALARLTGEELYKDKACEMAKQIGNQKRSGEGFFVNYDDSRCLCNAYASYPFYMSYETKDGGKERYNDIIAQINAMYSTLSEEAINKALNDDEHKYCSLAYFAAGMADTMEVMDQALYEIFAKLRGYLKDAVRVCIEAEKLGNSLNDCSAKMMIAYAIYKGCRMKSLHTEKYEEVADKLFECATPEGKNVEFTAAYILAYTESLKNRDYQDYGRTRGGVLWN